MLPKVRQMRCAAPTPWTLARALAKELKVVMLAKRWARSLCENADVTIVQVRPAWKLGRETVVFSVRVLSKEVWWVCSAKFQRAKTLALRPRMA